VLAVLAGEKDGGGKRRERRGRKKTAEQEAVEAKSGGRKGSKLGIPRWARPKSASSQEDPSPLPEGPRGRKGGRDGANTRSGKSPDSCQRGESIRQGYSGLADFYIACNWRKANTRVQKKVVLARAMITMADNRRQGCVRVFMRFHACNAFCVSRLSI